ncbi:hypothetical protein [Methylobacterium sp. J-068]|uniref:hypothetical protein n=1 Tax=Methylobacterium sp. J-068 TaxID=2836649 RepID=UPI001FB98D5E|nr:hypothetical protein [Methylobacterium sp. J-068]MCJ2036117.1 hypothetical protein [Methylobacterium sp. J-068]
MRLTPLHALLAAPLLSGSLAAHAVEMPVPPPAGAAPGTPVPIQTFPLTRVVPKGEARSIAFFSYLYPDCTSQGPVVARILETPRHGTVTFAATDSFPRYAAGSPLAACNAKKVPGLRMTHEAEEGFEGLDSYRILIINPDGLAVEYEVKVWVR